MAQAAAGKGLKLLGITEHSPGIPGTCDPIYFRNLHVVPRQMYGIELLLGAEINILDNEGNLDLDEFYLKILDLRIAGIHSLCYKWGTPEENTHGMVQVVSNPYIHIISHPGDGTAKLNFEPIVLAAKEHHTLLEINNSSLKPCRGKVDARSNNLEILKLCRRYDVPVILGSDAHISFDIATYDYALELVNETEFPEALIMNTSVSKFKKVFRYRSMKRVLFVCLGNICRSSSAEEIMRTYIKRAGTGKMEIEVDSAGISSYHQGELADDRMRAHAIRRGL